MKTVIRKEIEEKRKGLITKEVKKRSYKIISKLKEDKEFINAQSIMIYVSCGNEVDTHELIKEMIGKKRIIVPKVCKGNIQCCEISSFDDLNEGCCGILEPNSGNNCSLNEIDIVILPGVGFDTKGHRVGRGGGYFDKLLKSSKCPKVALAYDFQILDKVPVDEWDVKMDKIITDD